MANYFYNGERYPLNELIKLAKKKGVKLEDLDITYDTGGEPIPVFKNESGASKNKFNEEIKQKDSVLKKQEASLSEKDEEIAKLKALLEGPAKVDETKVDEDVNLDKLKKAALIDLANSKGLDVDGMTASEIREVLSADELA